MSHLEYQTPFHPGPYSSNGGSAAASTTTGSPGPGSLPIDPQQQQYTSHSHSQSQSQSQIQPQSAPHPDHPGQNHSHSRPPPPHFHDGLMQHQSQQQHHPHNYSPVTSYPGELPCLSPSVCPPVFTSIPSCLPRSTMTLPPLISPVMSSSTLLTHVQAASRVPTPRRRSLSP
jgi:hypothetical protein